MINIVHKWIIKETVTDVLNTYGYRTKFNATLKVLGKKCKYCHKCFLPGSSHGICNTFIKHTLKDVWIKVYSTEGIDNLDVLRKQCLAEWANLNKTRRGNE